MPERRFDEKELAEILREAAKRQAATSNAPGDDGYTIADIQKLAGEVGIEPKHITAAAEQIGEKKTASPRFNLWGAQGFLIRTRTLDVVYDDESWADALAEIQAEVGSTGTQTQNGQSREWHGGSDFAYSYFTAALRRGKTRLQFTYSQRGTLALTWILTFMFAFTVSMVTLAKMGKAGATSIEILSAIVLATAIPYLAVNRSLARWERKNQKKVDAIMARIEDAAPGQLAQTPQTAAAPAAETIQQRLTR